jgi:ubiquinone/menaquinone biosynthesis C-methylase UbiE
MEEYKGIEKTRQSFEKSFQEGTFYNSQTQDEEHLFRILAALDVPEGGRVLDLGCGSGYLTFPIARKYPGCEVTGLDIVDKTLEKNREAAREQGLQNLRFISYDGIIFPFFENFFNVVVTRYALHHFPNIKKTFGEIRRVLKPHGQLFISDPTPNGLDDERFIDKYMQMKDDGHVKYYTLSEYKDMAASAGLEFENHFPSSIRFPRKLTEEYDKILEDANPSVLENYQVEIRGSEIFTTQDVLNISFRKRGRKI